MVFLLALCTVICYLVTNTISIEDVVKLFFQSVVISLVTNIPFVYLIYKEERK